MNHSKGLWMLYPINFWVMLWIRIDSRGCLPMLAQSGKAGIFILILIIAGFFYEEPCTQIGSMTPTP